MIAVLAFVVVVRGCFWYRGGRVELDARILLDAVCGVVIHGISFCALFRTLKWLVGKHFASFPGDVE